MVKFSAVFCYFIYKVAYQLHAASAILSFLVLARVLSFSAWTLEFRLSVALEHYSL